MTTFFFFFFFSRLHQHSATTLDHLTQFRYLTREPVYQEQALTLVKDFPTGSERPFQFVAVPTPSETTLKLDHRLTDPRFSMQVLRSPVSNALPFPNQRKQQHAQNNDPLSISSFRKRIWITSHKEGQGSFGEGMRPFRGRHGMKLNK